MPKLKKVDHVHLCVPNRLQAERWYCDVLGFKRVKSLESWFTGDGPLTLENGEVHLALFESCSSVGNTIAFLVDFYGYQEWKKHFQHHELDYSESDHELSWSIYFYDPYGNPFEITCYEYDKISALHKKLTR